MGEFRSRQGGVAALLEYCAVLLEYCEYTRCLNPTPRGHRCCPSQSTTPAAPVHSAARQLVPLCARGIPPSESKCDRSYDGINASASHHCVIGCSGRMICASTGVHHARPGGRRIYPRTLHRFPSDAVGAQWRTSNPPNAAWMSKRITSSASSDAIGECPTSRYLLSQSRACLPPSPGAVSSRARSHGVHESSLRQQLGLADAQRHMRFGVLAADASEHRAHGLLLQGHATC